MSADADGQTPAGRQPVALPDLGPRLDSGARLRLVAALRSHLGPWRSIRDLADLVGVVLEPTESVPGGVAVCRGVVYFDNATSPIERQRIIGLGVAAAILADLFTAFTFEDIEPLAAALLLLVAPT